MKFFRSLNINQQRCPSELFEEIARLKPEGRRPGMFFLEAKPSDEESARLIEHIVALCTRRGLQETRNDTLGAYVHRVAPVYEASDLQTAPFLWLATQRKMFHDVRRDEQGRLLLPASQANNTVSVASIYPRPWIVVSDAVRQTLLKGNLVGMLFGEICLKGKSTHASTSPFWELKSSVVLPKMTNSMRRENDPVPSYKIEDSYGEPHYAHEDLEQLGLFDLGRTFEEMQTGESWLVVSQRLYGYCLRNDIPLEARPVRVRG